MELCKLKKEEKKISAKGTVSTIHVDYYVKPAPQPLCRRVWFLVSNCLYPGCGDEKNHIFPQYTRESVCICFLAMPERFARKNNFPSKVNGNGRQLYEIHIFVLETIFFSAQLMKSILWTLYANVYWCARMTNAKRNPQPKLIIVFFFGSVEAAWCWWCCCCCCYCCCRCCSHSSLQTHSFIIVVIDVVFSR